MTSSKKMTTPQKNNYVDDKDMMGGPGMDGENSGFRSASDAEATHGGYPQKQDIMNSSRHSAKKHHHQQQSSQSQPRYKIYQSMGFQGSSEDALFLICLVLKNLDFVSKIAILMNSC